MTDQGWYAFHEFVEKVGWGWAAFAMAAFFILSRLESVKNIFVAHRKVEHDDREQLSEENQQLISNLRLELDRQRGWREEDCRRYELVIAQLRDDNSRLTNAVVLSETGNSRLRHTLRNTMAWGQAVYRKCYTAGIPVAPLRLDDLFDLDPDLALKLREVLDEVDPTVPHQLGDGR